jgi:hypothetical protein
LIDYKKPGMMPASQIQNLKPNFELHHAWSSSIINVKTQKRNFVFHTWPLKTSWKDRQRQYRRWPEGAEMSREQWALATNFLTAATWNSAGITSASDKQKQ